MAKRTLRIAHSPDADDRFMFWALSSGAIASDLFEFAFTEADTQSLNRMAIEGSFDIIAVSAAHYPRIHHLYQPLRMGSSVGAGYGPVLVVQNPGPQGPDRNALLKSIRAGDWTLLTPGTETTAHHALKTLGYHFAECIEVPISPMELIFNELRHRSLAGGTQAAPDGHHRHQHGNQLGKVAALLIHEGRLVYAKYHTELVLDLGAEWQSRWSCNLPLGINVIRRTLPEDHRHHLSDLLRESMNYGIAHQEEFEHKYVQLGILNQAQLRHYLEMYANETTLDIAEADKDAFAKLIASTSHGLKGNPSVPSIPTDWI
jgi:1,4-dihydroxy-6-naphthoate synthase